MKLSILIPTLTSRREFLHRLMNVITPQVYNRDDVQIVTRLDNGEQTIGEKRNWLLQRAKGDYVAFIDDDDLVSDDYIAKLMEGIEKGVDCCSLTGEITFNGADRSIFEHSIKYKEYRTNNDAVYPNVKFERFPNHISCIKASIAKRFRFPDWNNSEDTAWATQVHKSGLIKEEHWIDGVIYYYEYRSKK